MERVCFTFEIYPGTESEYKKRHDEIWPEVDVPAIRVPPSGHFYYGRSMVFVGTGLAPVLVPPCGWSDL
jgi:L-rhamnose mutarotase